MTDVPGEVLAAFGAAGAAISPLGAGLINQTYLVQAASRDRFVLQRLHPVFAPEVNEDIDVVTQHLEAMGRLTPRLLRTTGGAAWCAHAGQVWRALTWIDGVSLPRPGSVAQTREAGRVLADFHLALRDLRHEFRHVRPLVHDTPRHLAALGTALQTHAAHPRYQAIAPLARHILAEAAALPPLPALPLRVVHGDPKLANILYSPDGARALCLVDLDTLARMPLHLELGDAFRSWCNPAGEDSAQAGFSLDLFAAAIGGYASACGGLPTPGEVGCIVDGTRTICIELAARFCADALAESYFGWDPRAFASRSEHNQVRAESQIAAARSLADQAAEARAIVGDTFRQFPVPATRCQC